MVQEYAEGGDLFAFLSRQVGARQCGGAFACLPGVAGGQIVLPPPPPAVNLFIGVPSTLLLSLDSQLQPS